MEKSIWGKKKTLLESFHYENLRAGMVINEGGIGPVRIKVEKVLILNSV